MKRETTTIVLDKIVVAEIKGNRSEFIREAIAEKLLRDAPSVEKIKAEIADLKKQSKILKAMLPNV